MGGLPDREKIQTQGRQDNAAQPLNAAEAKGGAERYPPVKPDDGVEATPEDRSFGGGNPEPRQGAGDGAASAAVNEGRLGPGGDPAEGKP